MSETGSTNLEFQNSTVLSYLDDTYKFEAESIALNSGNAEKGNYIVLNETIFHPQGGGQPSDVGTIEIDGKIYQVNFVALNNSGVVYHYINGDVESDISGKSAKLRVDQERRINNAKSHTAGHLLSCLIEKLAPELKGIKGYHFPEGPYVEFQGKLTSLSNTELIDTISKLSQECILNQAKIRIQQVDVNEYNELKSTSYTGNKVRLMEIDSFEAIPCGGTHLRDLSELKTLSIKKIQASKGNTRISYLYS